MKYLQGITYNVGSNKRKKASRQVKAERRRLKRICHRVGHVFVDAFGDAVDACSRCECKRRE